MSKKSVRLGITSVVLALAFGGMLYSTLSEGTEYYKHVEEVMANPAPWHGKKLQIHGFAKDVRRERHSLDYRFIVESGGKQIHATYKGVVPDTFKDGAEVVVKGLLTADGGFNVERGGIMAKCPSKYDPAAGGGTIPK